MTYAEAETVIVAAAVAHFTGKRICTETPNDLAAVVPAIRITRFSGISDEIYTFDNPQVDFDCYAATRAAAQTLAYDVRAWVRQTLPGSIIGDDTTGRAFVARSQDIQGPVWTPYDNTSLRRFTYSAALRLHALEVS